jgi:hypothetical protein
MSLSLKLQWQFPKCLRSLQGRLSLSLSLSPPPNPSLSSPPSRRTGSRPSATRLPEPKEI